MTSIIVAWIARTVLFPRFLLGTRIGKLLAKEPMSIGLLMRSRI